MPGKTLMRKRTTLSRPDGWQGATFAPAPPVSISPRGTLRHPMYISCEEGLLTWIAQHDIVVTKLRDLTSKQAQEVIDLLTQAAKTPDAENKE